MDIAFIDRLISLVEHSTLAELEYSEHGAHVRLTKTLRAGAVASGTIASPRPAAEAAAAPAVSASDAPAVVAPTHTVRAGIVGTFYRAPAPDQLPFVQLGDLVAEGQPLAMIEAMKMLNQVEADRAGRIAAILADDGSAVSGQSPLFEIAPLEDDRV